MRRAALAVAGLALSAPAWGGGAVIPFAYRGEFSPDPKFCGLPIYVDFDEPPRSNDRIWVRADYIRGRFHKRHVVAVTRTRRGLDLQFDLRIDEFPPPSQLELSKDGEMLNGRYRRCHSKSK